MSRKLGELRAYTAEVDSFSTKKDACFYTIAIGGATGDTTAKAVVKKAGEVWKLTSMSVYREENR